MVKQQPTVPVRISALILSALVNVFCCFIASLTFGWGLSAVFGIKIATPDIMLLAYGTAILVSFMVSIIKSFND